MFDAGSGSGCDSGPGSGRNTSCSIGMDDGNCMETDAATTAMAFGMASAYTPSKNPLSRHSQEDFRNAGYPVWVRARYLKVKDRERSRVRFLRNVIRGSAAPVV
ncbi:hypothetical protein EST38_g6917 [Candolleomyces aberdarensis]|uniref:Uncharacterized protein n=1 Tax=Candolleomyces aberdarensis TaxID=2316362 RepID=A0A4Q2DIJ1_9AGAR|nr:hypothetical protein EST38_g6917 [Candolleomyces aberdarensis]